MSDFILGLSTEGPGLPPVDSLSQILPGIAATDPWNPKPDVTGLGNIPPPPALPFRPGLGQSLIPAPGIGGAPRLPPFPTLVDDFGNPIDGSAPSPAAVAAWNAITGGPAVPGQPSAISQLGTSIGDAVSGLIPSFPSFSLPSLPSFSFPWWLIAGLAAAGALIVFRR